MDHYTLNTGQSRVSPRHEVWDSVIERCRPWCASGWHKLPLPGWRLRSTQGDLGSLLFTLHRGNEPIVTCGVAPDETAADEIWPVLEHTYLDCTDWASHRSVERPTRTPWLAVVMIAPPGVYAAEVWIDDLERCIAWAWLEYS